MNQMHTAVTTVITLLALVGSAFGSAPASAAYAPPAQEVGADCTEPPNLEPFADLHNCDLSGRQMAGANLYNANLSSANLSGSDLSGAVLQGVNLTGANLTGANLNNADLFTSTLISAIFDNANLREANMDDAYAPGGSFINADLRGANLYFTFFRGGNLSGANFSNTALSFVDFESAVLQNTNFSGAGLSVDLRNSDLRGADLSFSTLYYISINNADLRNATLLGADRQTGTNMDGVVWGNTICADGSNSDDNDGDNFTCDSNFPTNQLPTVSMTSPANNTTVTRGAKVNLSANAADSDGSVIRVEFYAGSTLLNTDPSAPYSFSWTTTTAGTFALTARAYDDNNESSVSQAVTLNVVPPPNNTPPTVAITSPKNNATVYRILGTTINVTAADANGAVTRVEFYADGALLGADTAAPYSFFWRPTSTGNKTLTAKAYDNDGAVTTSSQVTVRVR